ncbi:MAG: hypothetical protein VCD00_09860, partial [Candidatus Hydrogenedentota bacterium]
MPWKRSVSARGWSRAWNKYGMNTFRSHICKAAEDGDYLEPGDAFLRDFATTLDAPYAAFVDELISDPSRMIFTFYHNAEYDGVQYEG